MFDGAAVIDAAHAAPDAAAKALIPAVPTPVQVRAADPSQDGGRTEVVFIDTSLANYQALEAAQKPGVEIEEIDGGQSGLAQIAKWAESHAGYDSISVIGHGAEASLQVGTDTITDSSLAGPVARAELAEIGAALKSGGELLVFADGVGKGTDGQQFCADLTSATGAIAGIFGDSTDSTGGDGNWTLDAATGAIEIQAAQPVLDGGRTEVVFIDTNVADYQALVAAVKPGIEIELFGGGQDGLAQIAAWAATHSGYESISVLSHGAEAEARLGSRLIDEAALADATVKAELAQLGAALKSGGTLQIYGCDVAAGADGQQFVNELAADTGAVVAASTDATGAAALGGDWTLETATGQPPTQSPFVAELVGRYDGLLALATDGTLVSNGASISFLGTSQSGNTIKVYVEVLANTSDFGTYTMKATGSWGATAQTSVTVNGATPNSNFAGYSYIKDFSGSPLVLTGPGVTGSNFQVTVQFTGGPGNVTGIISSVSYTLPPFIASATYAPATGILSISGAYFTNGAGGYVLSDLTLKGGANQTYTLGSGDTVMDANGTIAIGASHQATLAALFDKAGTVSAEGTTYNLAATAGWDTNAVAQPINTVTEVLPTISGASYNSGTGVLTVSGANFTTSAGNYVLGDLTVKGGSGGTYTLGNGDTLGTLSSSSVTINIATANQATITALFDKGGTSSLEGITYNLAAIAGWDTGYALAQATNTVTATDSVSPTLTHSGSSTVTTEATVGWTPVQIDNGTITVTSTPNNWNGGKLVVTDGSGADSSHDTLTIGTVGGITASGSTAGSTVSYNGSVIGTIKSGSTGAPGTSLEIDFNSATATNTVVAALAKAIQFGETVTGTPTTGSRTVSFTLTTPYGGTASLSDTVTAGNYPTITSAAYNAATGALAVTGAGMTTTATNFNPALLRLTGDDGVGYNLTTANTAITGMSAAGFTLTLSAADKLAINGLLDKNGTSAYSGTLYNLTASGSWDTGSALAVTTAGVTVSGTAAPAITSATYNAATHVLAVTGTNLVNLGATTGIDPTKLSLSGDNGVTYALTTAATAVSGLSATGFSVTLNATDQVAIEPYLDATGTHPATNSGASYGLAAATGWDTDASVAVTNAAVTVTATNHAPSLAATGGAQTYTEGGAAAALFSGVTASVGTLDQYTGQTIQAITLTVSGLANGAGEILNVDGTAVALTSGNSVTTTNGYTVAVTVASSTATVTLSKTGNIAVTSAPALIQGITYQNTSVDQVSASTRTVTLTGITDSGGTANSGIASATPSGTAAVVTLHAIDNAPTLTGTPANATVTTPGALTVLFPGATASPVEAAQSITSVTIAITGIAAGDTEQVLYNGASPLSLVSGASGTINGIAYTVGTVSGGPPP